ncbi:MAG: hypothetical protein V1835_04320 [Candidatus Micrarchaeota archaeon]
MGIDLFRRPDEITVILFVFLMIFTVHGFAAWRIEIFPCTETLSPELSATPSTVHTSCSLQFGPYAYSSVITDYEPISYIEMLILFLLLPYFMAVLLVDVFLVKEKRV